MARPGFEPSGRRPRSRHGCQHGKMARPGFEPSRTTSPVTAWMPTREDGETRIRTGDTTIFRRSDRSLEIKLEEYACKGRCFVPQDRPFQSAQIARFVRAGGPRDDGRGPWVDTADRRSAGDTPSRRVAPYSAINTTMSGGCMLATRLGSRLRCLTGGARTVCVLRVARVRSRLKERQAGAVPRPGSPVPLKGRDVFIAARRAGRQRVRARRDGVGGCA